MPRDEKATQAYARAKKSGKPSIERVIIRKAVDTNPDLSFIGEYTDEAGEWYIERESGEYVHDLPEDHETPTRSREYRYFKPYAGGEKPGTSYYRKYGLQDFERMESYNNQQWCMIGITTEAEVLVPIAGDSCHVQQISGGSLWGIESDSESSFFESTAKDCLAELWSQLSALNVPQSEIDAAKSEIDRNGIEFQHE